MIEGGIRLVEPQWGLRPKAAPSVRMGTVTVSRWSKNEQGERVQVQHQRVTRAWFFAQDGGHYVQCKYGARPLPLSKDGNAVFVKQLTDVSSVLQAFYAAAAAGEFDSAIASAAKRASKS